MDKTQKQQVVAELKDNFTAANTVIVAHYKGLTVDEITKLRSNMLEVGAGFKVTKNSLAKLAIEGTQYQSLKDVFKGPTAVAYSEDPVAAAKGVVEFAKKNDKLVVIGGAINDDVIDVAKIEALAKLPSLDELRAKLVAMISTPATRIAGVIQAPAGQVARVIGAYSQQG